MTAINLDVSTNERSIQKASQLAHAISRWVARNKKDKILVGYSKNAISKKMAEAMVKVFGAFHIRVNYATQPITDDALTKGVQMTKSCLGIMVDYKKNIPVSKTINLKNSNGKALPPQENQIIQTMVTTPKTDDIPDLDEMMDEGLLNYIDMKILQKLANKI